MSGWHVHVIGPDDLHPVRSQLEAINLAHRLNGQISNTVNLEGISESSPYIWAVPVPPNNTAALERKA